MNTENNETIETTSLDDEVNNVSTQSVDDRYAMLPFIRSALATFKQFMEEYPIDGIECLLTDEYIESLGIDCFRGIRVIMFDSSKLSVEDTTDKNGIPVSSYKTNAAIDRFFACAKMYSITITTATESKHNDEKYTYTWSAIPVGFM